VSFVADLAAALLNGHHARSRPRRSRRVLAYCVNRHLHGGRRYPLTKRVWRWHGQDMCEWCFKFHTARIHVCNKRH
jgi:hypothetical protein